ncbi:MAG: S8 family serine peptidase, partial [bacterium]
MHKKFVVILTISAALSLGKFAAAIESAFEWPQVRSSRVLIETDQLLWSQLHYSPDGHLQTGLLQLDKILLEIGASVINPLAPKYQPDLYLLIFKEDLTVEEAILRLRKVPTITNVWPCVLLPWSELKYTPDDLLLPSQWHIDQIKAPAAWGIYRGSDTVQVAIIDGGVDYDHPDLSDNVWINTGEDLDGNGVIELSDWNGLDDDENGYVDDFWGWDWINLGPGEVWPGEDPGPPDNDPSDFDGHGTH